MSDQSTRREYHKIYYRLYRSGNPVWRQTAMAPPRRSGRTPRLSRDRYDALIAWRSSHKRARPKLWDLADQWGEDVGYLWGLVRRGSKRYDRERYEELLSLMRECVDEARAET